MLIPYNFLLLFQGVQKDGGRVGLEPRCLDGLCRPSLRLWQLPWLPSCVLPAPPPTRAPRRASGSSVVLLSAVPRCGRAAPAPASQPPPAVPRHRDGGAVGGRARAGTRDRALQPAAGRLLQSRPGSRSHRCERTPRSHLLCASLHGIAWAVAHSCCLT